jgi:hypothetical protein
MTDRELDQRVADTAPVSDAWVASLDLRGAEMDLMEEIMAMDSTELDLAPEPPPQRTGRARYRIVIGAAVVAAALVTVVVGVRSTEDKTNDTQTDVTTPPTDEVPRLLAGWVPEGFELANTLTDTATAIAIGDIATTVGDPNAESEPGADVSYTAYYSSTPTAAGLGWIDITTSSDLSAREVGGTESPVTVRGHEGTMYTTAANGSIIGSISVRWEEAPNIMVTVSANNSDVTTDDVLEIAESLHPVSEEEWERGSHLNDPLSAADLQALVPEEAIASALFDFRGTAAYLRPDGQACAFLADNRSQTATVCGPSSERVNILLDRIGFPALLFGVLPDGATHVVATRDGEDVNNDPLAPPDTPQQVYLATDPATGQTLYAVNVGRIPNALTFLDDQEQIVESVPLDIDPDI